MRPKIETTLGLEGRETMVEALEELARSVRVGECPGLVLTVLVGGNGAWGTITHVLLNEATDPVPCDLAGAQLLAERAICSVDNIACGARAVGLLPGDPAAS